MSPDTVGAIAWIAVIVFAVYIVRQSFDDAKYLEYARKTGFGNNVRAYRRHAKQMMEAQLRVIKSKECEK